MPARVSDASRQADRNLVKEQGGRPIFLGMNGYQWTVMFAAWLGWGFDIFDGLLFTFVAPNCIPTLLGLRIGSPEAKPLVTYYTGLFTALLLVGWALGGILFGRLADRIGRTRCLSLTMITYSLGTAMCAFAPNLAMLAVFRLIASLGIGGEWAAGASLVNEVVPKDRRVEAGALLYTSAPMGLFLADFVNLQVAGKMFVGHPSTSWRWVFLCGLIPAMVAMVVRHFVKEPEVWVRESQKVARPVTISDLFKPNIRPLTFSGFAMALTALLCWWTCNAFLPVITTNLAQQHLAHTAPQVVSPDATPEQMKVAEQTKERWKSRANFVFNIGGLLGTLLTIPFAKRAGRRFTFGLYFILSSVSIFICFGIPMSEEMRINNFFLLGLTVFGVFGMFTYYLPELFPTRLRATGSGFCYNIGRVLTAGGPFMVGLVGLHWPGQQDRVLTWVSIVPLLGACCLPWVIETRNRDPEEVLTV